jgi:hypothetical protein
MSAPTQRIDNEAMKEVERFSTEQMAYMMADWIDALAKSGAVYPQIVLPADEASRKAQLMQGGS